jgi:RNA polymerase sigma-70 factor (ECF subfamily)
MLSTECTDLELVQAVVRGNQDAFTTLVERYRKRIINFIFLIIRDVEKSEDLSQEAFIRVHRHIGKFDQSKKFSTWVYTIAKNLATNELRNRSRSPLVLFQTLEDQKSEDDDRPIDFGTTDETPDKIFERERLRKIVDDCLEELSATHRQIFVLREMEGKSYEEIADLTGIPPGTVKSQLNRARNSFMASVLLHPEW